MDYSKKDYEELFKKVKDIECLSYSNLFKKHSDKVLISRMTTGSLGKPGPAKRYVSVQKLEKLKQDVLERLTELEEQIKELKSMWKGE